MARALNTSELAWAGASGNAVGETASWLGSWDALTGGNFLFGIEISNSPSALALGEVYFIAANGLVYTQTVASNEVDSVAQDSLRGRFGGVVGAIGTQYYAMHTGNPGTNGANPLPDLPRIAVLGSGFTYQT